MEIAPGFTLCPGTRAPSVALWGDKVFCQLRCGVIGKEPWPIATQDWIHRGTEGDIIAIRKAND